MKFTKEIVGPGKYRATDPATGKRKDEVVTATRIKNWVDTFKRMKDAGIQIPAPFKHDLTLAGLNPDQVKALADDEKAKGSLRNGGFWEELFTNDQGKLCGIIDVPDSLADTVGKTVKECSLLALPEYEDGSGNKWSDPILHVALVTHPVVTGQENFQPLVSETHTAVAMSQFIEPVSMDTGPDNGTVLQATPAYLSQAVEVLNQLGIPLPSDTTVDNVLERIAVSGGAILTERTKKNEGGIPHEGHIIQTHGATVMSVDPNSPEGKFRMKLKKKELEDRITKGLTEGRYSIEYVNEVLTPMLSGCVMSLDLDAEGNLGPTSLDPVLEALERLPVNGALTGTLVKNGQKVVKTEAGAFAVEQPPKDESVPLTEEDAAEINERINQNIGRPTKKKQTQTA